MKVFDKLYIYKTLSQSTNYVEFFNQPCRLERVVEKFYTIYFQIKTLIEFVFSCWMQFILYKRNWIVTLVESGIPRNKSIMSLTEK